ncbi:glutathione S-transferase N-terminal domain-containing protein [Lysobacter humi (ex Lee et al. 2017)]
MKLYTMPGACSTACHISLRWSGLPFDVHVLTREALKGPEYLAVNPGGAVPALVDGDFVLTQNAAILGYAADLAPASGLAGDGSARQRAEANRWLAFVNADLHPAFHPLFGPARFLADEGQHEALKAAARARLRGMFERADAQLRRGDWLAGFRSYADPYLYITLRWATRTGVDLAGFEGLEAFRARMDADPDVRAALSTEGLA